MTSLAEFEPILCGYFTHMKFLACRVLYPVYPYYLPNLVRAKTIIEISHPEFFISLTKKDLKDQHKETASIWSGVQ